MSKLSERMLNVVALAERMGNAAYAAEMRRWHRENDRFHRAAALGQADFADHFDHWIESCFATSRAQDTCDWVTGQWLGAWLVGMRGGTIQKWANLFCDLVDEASDLGEVLDTFEALELMLEYPFLD